MRYSELKELAGIANLTINSGDYRYSELLELANRVSSQRRAILTVIVNEASLTTAEILTLGRMGQEFIAFDLSKT